MQTILSSPYLQESVFDLEPVPARAGIGLKPQHIDEILETGADIGFFEVHAENYMGGGGIPHAQLAEIRHNYPLSVHGVGMSIGGEGPIDQEHLARFKAVVHRYQPGLVSEHLAWSTHDDVFYNDLLPVPYTQETLQRVIDHVDMVQSAIGRQILIENPSTYIIFQQSTLEETGFMAELARRSGCGLLLDVNNVFVSATNHGFSPQEYLDRFPFEHVRQLHLGGHAPDTDEAGNQLLIDAHDREICDEVWQLYSHVLEKTGPLPSLIEWDNDVPEWSVLAGEARRADQLLGRNTPQHGRQGVLSAIAGEPNHAA